MAQAFPCSVGPISEARPNPQPPLSTPPTDTHTGLDLIFISSGCVRSCLIWMWFHALMQRQIVKCDFIKSFIRIHQWDWIRKRSLCKFGPLTPPMAPLALALPLVCLRSPHFSLICSSWRGGWPPLLKRICCENGEKWALWAGGAIQKVKVTLSPPPRLLPLFSSSLLLSFPRFRSPAPLQDDGATNHLYALIWVYKLRWCLLLTEQMTFREGGVKGERLFSGTWKHQLELELKLRGKLLAPYVIFRWGLFFFHWVHVMHASAHEAVLLGVNCCHWSVMCALMGTPVYLYL